MIPEATLGVELLGKVVEGIQAPRGVADRGTAAAENTVLDTVSLQGRPKTQAAEGMAPGIQE